MNINQFNLFKTTKQCKNANLTEDDYNKNQEFLEELEQAEEKYEEEIQNIKSKYTCNQRIIKTAYNMYISRYSEYKMFLKFGLGLLIFVIFALLISLNNGKIHYEVVIPFGIISIIFLVSGIYSYFKIRKFNKLK